MQKNLFQSFFNQENIHIDEQTRFSYPSNDNDQASNHFYILSQYELIAVEGQDADKFLQGQTSCDIRLVDQQHGSYGTFTSIKGRVQSDFYIMQLQENSYLLRVHYSINTQLKASLNKYIAFAKADFSDLNKQYCCIGLTGEQASKNLEPLFEEVLITQHQQIKFQQSLIACIDVEQHIYQCWLHIDDIQNLWPIISKNLYASPSSAWQAILINLGIAEIQNSTTDQYTPHMLNAQLTGAINFKKGCYTGQEIIARTEYKATLKKQMYKICFDSETPAEENMELIDAEGKTIGNIINTAQTGETTHIALAIINNSAINDDLQKNTIKIAKINAIITLPAQPYAINI